MAPQSYSLVSPQRTEAKQEVSNSNVAQLTGILYMLGPLIFCYYSHFSSKKMRVFRAAQLVSVGTGLKTTGA